MTLKTGSQLHFDHVDRHFLSQKQDHVGVSSDEILGLLGSVGLFGTWRLEIDTGQVFWSEDASRIHSMEKSEGPVSLSHILATYHPEDAELVEQVVSAATSERKNFRFVLRVKSSTGGHKMVAVAGRYRANKGGELIGYCHEFNESVRSIVFTGD
ncbi:hypothetical protein SAMN05877838_0912 [Hoeflea halophila]|uniref:PAS domain-containing protein n=1 Tax=Hoeflea halophila TaxID=714899 RepID=A0A286HYW8_9HYPH|nr:hypothetical protein [Hoeflea halophila]SOE12927.1 hypothetical protein SAMN05877838_0912 [Hoeflea halophila]